MKKNLNKKEILMNLKKAVKFRDTLMAILSHNNEKKVDSRLLTVYFQLPDSHPLFEVRESTDRGLYLVVNNNSRYEGLSLEEISEGIEMTLKESISGTLLSMSDFLFDYLGDDK